MGKKKKKKIKKKVKYVKSKILSCRKKKFCVQTTYCQKSKNVPNLQVMWKKTCLSHPCSNKTPCTGCLTNWIVWLQNKKLMRDNSFNCGNPILRETHCFQIVQITFFSLDIVLLASSNLALLPFSFESMSGKRKLYC